MRETIFKKWAKHEGRCHSGLIVAELTQISLVSLCWIASDIVFSIFTVKILKIGTPEIITLIVLQLERLDFTVQYCVQKMQTE